VRGPHTYDRLARHGSANAVAAGNPSARAADDEPTQRHTQTDSGESAPIHRRRYIGAAARQNG